MTDTVEENTEREWHTCHKSGQKFQVPNGAKCALCKEWYITKHYLYVDMEPICLDCRRKQVERIILNLKQQLNQGT